MKLESAIAAGSSEELIDFPELARTIGRYKWGILGITLLATALAALAAFTIEPTYRGTVSVMLELRPQRVVQIQDVYDPGTGLADYYGTQYMVLKSRQLAEKVVDKLNLVEHPAFNKEKGAVSQWLEKLDPRRFLPFLPPVEDTPESPESKRTAVVQSVVESLTVEPITHTQIIVVHFDSSDQQLAVDVPNTLAELYIESGLQAKLDATQKATSWLTEKLEEIRKNLAASEAALQAFREQEQLVNVGGARTLSEEELVDYSRRLREAQKTRADFAASFEKIRAAGNDPKRLRSISALLVDPLVQRASEGYLSAQEAVKQLEERYGSKHPQMATARARLSTAEAAFDAQLRVAAQGLKTEYELAREAEEVLSGQVATARSQIRRLDRKDNELSSLQREVDANRELFDTFMTRFKETDTTSGFDNLIARVVDPAVKSQKPFAPSKKKWILLGAAAGFLASLMLALLHYALSEGIRNAEELESLAQLPVFGVLPMVTGLLGRKKSLPRLYIEKPQTPFSEGIRSIRAALQLNAEDRGLKRIMVTSAVPSEGKSSVCGSLALAFGATERVLLIETDLRKPSLGSHFRVGEGRPGLTDVLNGSAKLQDCLIPYENSNLTLLLAGRVPSNPAELLSSETFAKLLTEADKHFDRILLDSPPCQATSDALLLGHLVHGTVFVVKSEATARRAVKSSLKQLRFARVPLTGLVINQVDTSRNSSYAQGYYYAYSYYR